MDNQMKMQEPTDSAGDALASLVLIAVFVATCIFWIGGQ